MEMVSTEAVGVSRSLKWLAIEMNEKQEISMACRKSGRHYTALAKEAHEIGRAHV